MEAQKSQKGADDIIMKRKMKPRNEWKQISTANNWQNVWKIFY